MKNIYILLFLFHALFSISQENTNDQLKVINNYIENIQKENGIPGIAVAIIHQGKTIYRKNMGYANLEHKVPITDKSIFGLYSLTKPIISTGVFQLIELGKVNLEDTISKYIDSLPNNWRGIKVQSLLTHSSGLPDMVGKSPSELRDLTEEEIKTKVFETKLEFEEGEKYKYNQTNYWLLKLIIEKVSEMSLEDYIIKNQFRNAKKGVLFSNDARDIIKDRVTSYFPFSKGYLTISNPYVNGDYFYACNGLYLTLDNFIAWDKSLRENNYITQVSKKKMWKMHNYPSSEKLFANGWGIYPFKKNYSYGFSGSLCVAYRIFPDSDLSIIFLSNGLSSFYSIDNVIDRIAAFII